MANVYYHNEKTGEVVDSGSIGGEEALKEMKKYARKCNHCDKVFNEGFVLNDGETYFCSEECLNKNMTTKEYEDMYNDGNGYYTIWEDEEDFQYYENGQEIKD